MPQIMHYDVNSILRKRVIHLNIAEIYEEDIGGLN